MRQNLALNSNVTQTDFGARQGVLLNWAAQFLEDCLESFFCNWHRRFLFERPREFILLFLENLGFVEVALAVVPVWLTVFVNGGDRMVCPLFEKHSLWFKEQLRFIRDLSFFSSSS